MFQVMSAARRRALAAALAIPFAVAGPLGPASASGPWQDPADLPGSEHVDGLVAAGLETRAEEILRRRVSKGDSAACLPLLQLLVRRDASREASSLLAQWHGPAALPGEGTLFTAGRIYETSDRAEAALEAYRASAAGEPWLADHATYRGGLALEKLGRIDEALAAYEAAGEAARTRSLAALVGFRAATLAADHDRAARAQAFLDLVPAASPVPPADRLGLQARLDRARGDSAAEARTLRALLADAPASEAALEATKRLSELEAPTVADFLRFAEIALANRHAPRAEDWIDRALAALGKSKEPKLEGRARLLRGKAEIVRRAWTSARDELARLPAAADPADRAEAVLEAARCLWRLGRVDACLEEYDAIARGDFPDSTRAVAAWEAAREARDDRRGEEAARRFADFRRAFPSSALADDALWQQGRALAEAGRRDDALTAFAAVRSAYPDSSWALESAYWSALLRRAAHDTTGACGDAGALVREHPDEYWAQRARELRAGLGCADPAAVPNGAAVDPATWLADSSASRGGSDPGRAAQSLRAGEAFRRARSLAATGLVADAEAELASLRRTADADASELAALSEAAWSIGVPREGMRGTSILKRRRNANVRSGEMPAGLARLLYPVAHLDAVFEGAAENRLDPLFVLAVMREESWFDPNAVSGAGARGLLQIMPATGYDLAGRVGLHGFAADDLFVPNTSIRLGTRYLRELLDASDQEPVLALAAYNAGKDNAARWRDGQSGPFDVDRYVAAITYRETYGYVQKVMRTWEIYRFLWGDALAEWRPARAGDRAR
jgi:soluble lytic murein transglycosylase